MTKGRGAGVVDQGKPNASYKTLEMMTLKTRGVLRTRSQVILISFV